MDRLENLPKPHTDQLTQGRSFTSMETKAQFFYQKLAKPRATLRKAGLTKIPTIPASGKLYVHT